MVTGMSTYRFRNDCLLTHTLIVIILKKVNQFNIMQGLESVAYHTMFSEEDILQCFLSYFIGIFHSFHYHVYFLVDLLISPFYCFLLLKLNEMCVLFASYTGSI